jgi:hypothetical protein
MFFLMVFSQKVLQLPLLLPHLVKTSFLVDILGDRKSEIVVALPLY